MRGATITALAFFVFLWVVFAVHPRDVQDKPYDEKYIETLSNYTKSRYEQQLGEPVEPLELEVMQEKVECPYTEFEIWIFRRTGMSEGGTLCVEAIQAITQVEMNRAKSNYREFANQNTIYDVVYGKAHQFSTADNGEPNEKVIFAVDSAIAYPEAFPTDMLWFNSNHWPTYGYPYTEIDGMYFSTVTNYREDWD